MKSILLVLVAMLIPVFAGAQAYPSKSIRLVVPFSPGGNIDITARTVSTAMSEILGQNILVDNRAGAGGSIGSDIVAKSPADGYTLLMGSNSVYGVAPNLYKNVYNPARDFAGVSILTSVPFVLVVHPSVPAKNVRELVAVAKAKKGMLTLSSPGIGSTNHLVGELFQTAIGVRMIAVPYKGSGPALADLIAGHVDSHMDQLTSSIGYIQSGKIRAIAVTTSKRAQALPQVPTMEESGLKGFDATTSTGIIVPAGTPKAIIDRLNAAAVEALRRPAVRDRFTSLGADVVGSTADHFTAYIREDFAKWGKVIKDANIKID